MKARAGSVFLLLIVTACVALAVCATALLFYITTPGGERRVAAMVEATTSATNGYRVTIEGLEISLPAVLSADAVHLSSIDGQWLAARDVLLVVDATALLSGSVRAADLRIGELTWSALPPAEETAEDDDTAAWPREIDVASLHVDRAFVATALLEVLTSAVLEGDESENVGPISVDGSVRYRFGNNRLDIEARAAAVELSGTASESTAWHVVAPRVDLVLENLLERASVHARVSVENSDIGKARAASGNVSVNLSPVAAGITLRRSDRFHAEVAIDLRSPTIEGVDAALFGEKLSLQSSLGLGPEIFPVEVDSLTINGAGFVADARATVSSPSALADAHIDIDVDDIALLGAPLHASLRVGANAHGDLESDEGVVAEADLEARDIDWSDSGLPSAVTTPLGTLLSTTVHAAIRRDTENDAVDIDAQSVELRCGALTASSDGLTVRGPERHVEGGLDVAVPELAPWSDALGRALHGAAALRVDLQGTLGAPQASASLQVTPVTIEGLPLTAFVAHSDTAALRIPTSVRMYSTATITTATITTETGTTTTGATGSVEAAATLTLAGDGSLGLHDALITTPNNRIAMNVDLAPDGDLTRLVVDADLPSLAEIGDLLDVSASGQANVELRYAPAAGEPAKLHATLSAVDVPSLATGVHSFEIHAEATGVDADAPAQASLSVIGLRYAGIELDRVDTTAERRAGQWRTSCEIEDKDGGVDVSFAVDVTESAEGWLARARELRGILGGEPASFARDAVCERSEDGTLRIDVGIAVGQGELNARWTVATQRQFGTLDASVFPLRYVAPLLDPALQLDGTISAEVFVPEDLSATPTSGTTSTPSTDALPRARIVLADVRSRAITEFPGFDLELVARHEQRALTFSGDLVSALGGRLHTDGRITTDTASTGAFSGPFAGVGSDSLLEATLSGGLGEQAVAEFASIADQRLRGRLAADLQVTGRVGTPVLSGALTLSEGHYDARITAAELTDINAELHATRADPDRAEIVVTARDGNTGRLSARGELDLSAGILAPVLDAKIELVRVRAARLDEAKLTVDGELRLIARSKNLSLSGHITATDVDLTIPDHRPPDVIGLDGVEHTAALLEHVPRRQTARAAALPIDLDVRIDVPGPAFVRGRDLTTEWRGGADVTGTTSAPRLDGGLDLIRGNLTVLGVRFQAANGAIRFDPTPWRAPHLNVRGDMRRAGVTVSVIVSGLLTNLSIDFQSDPPMQRDEILSFVLFGTNIGSLTTVQAVQLAAAVAAIARPGPSLNPTGWIRRSAGLDRVELTQSDNDDSTFILSAGRYVRDGVYVSVDQPLGQGASEFAVELEVTRSITLRSSVGADASGGLGATWSYDY